MATLVYTQIKPEEIDLPPVRITSVTPTTPPKEPPKTDHFKPEPINISDIDHEVTADKTIVSDLDIIITEPMTSEDNENTKDIKGRQEAVSDSELGGPGAFIAIGPGGGGKGAFGRRIGGGGDKRAIGRAYGPHAKGVMTTLDAALRWLKRHQKENGMWSAQNYFNACKDEGPKCEPGKGAQGADEAMTGYAVLCFLGAGYDHKTPNKYKQVVKKGLEWIVANQKADGLIGTRNYEHAIATQALVEAYAMTNDPELRGPSQKAVDIIIARQSIDSKAADKEYAALGWDYVNPNANRNDTSVSCWNIFALKSAVAAGLKVGNSMAGAKVWLEKSWKAANPNWDKLSDPYKDTSIFPYTWNATDNSVTKDHLSFAGGCAAVFLGHRSGDIMLESMANDVDKRWLDTGKWKNNLYCVYYSSLFSFQLGDKHWLSWRDVYLPYLIQNQYNDNDGACKSGTWKFDAQEFHGWDTSRVLLHTYATLSLGVAIRYELVNKK